MIATTSFHTNSTHQQFEFLFLELSKRTHHFSHRKQMKSSVLSLIYYFIKIILVFILFTTHISATQETHSCITNNVRKSIEHEKFGKFLFNETNSDIVLLVVYICEITLY